jgi:hypothetical protein
MFIHDALRRTFHGLKFHQVKQKGVTVLAKVVTPSFGRSLQAFLGVAPGLNSLYRGSDCDYNTEDQELSFSLCKRCCMTSGKMNRGCSVSEGKRAFGWLRYTLYVARLRTLNQEKSHGFVRRRHEDS